MERMNFGSVSAKYKHALQFLVDLPEIFHLHDRQYVRVDRFILIIFRVSWQSKTNLNIIHLCSQLFAMLNVVKTSELPIRAKKTTLCVFSYLKYKAMTLFLQHTQTTLTFIESGQWLIYFYCLLAFAKPTPINMSY